MSAAEASSRFAAICLPLSMIFSEASCSAEPPTGSAREPPVRPRGERSESPYTTSMRSASMPSRSDTSCLYEVTSPVPYS